MPTRFDRDPTETGADAELREKPTGDLVKELSAQVSTLVRAELELAKAELSEKGKKAGVGGGMLGGGGVLALFGLALLLTTAVLALQLVMADWLAALLVSLAVLTAAGLLAMMGKNRVQEAGPPTPEQAISEGQRTVDSTKQAVQDGRR